VSDRRQPFRGEIQRPDNPYGRTPVRYGGSPSYDGRKKSEPVKSAPSPVDGWEIWEGDCVEKMRELPEASIDAIVTDPPYGLEFMGKEWDRLEAENVGQASHGGFSEGEFKGFRLASYNASANVKCRSCEKWKWDWPGRKCECASPNFPNLRAIQARSMQNWHNAWATEALRVLKPGGHLLAFGGTRTAHRLACAIEDAGFEIRDSILYLGGGAAESSGLAWLYGSGLASPRA
jgi:hypothetical protein